MKKLFIAVALILSSVVSVGSSTNIKNIENVWTYQSYTTMMADREKQHECLAKNIYFEARNEPFVGQFAVALVTLNRVHDSAFPNTICDVVYQGIHHADGFPKRDRCQFSWYCDGKSDEIPKYDHNAWQIATWVANGVLHGKLNPITKGATHYHADYVLPEWAETKTKTKVIGNHIFYRWEK